MPRRKRAENVKISSWLSANDDNRERRFIQVGNSLLFSAAFQDLNAGARMLYLSMTMEAGGKREFTFSHGAGRKYGFKNTTFDRYIKELQKAGFIKLLADHDTGRFSANKFQFVFDWRKTGRQNYEH